MSAAVRWANESDPVWLAGWLEHLATWEPGNEPAPRALPQLDDASKRIVAALADLLVADLLRHPPGTV